MNNANDPMDCSTPGSSVHGIFHGKNTGVDCCSLLQGILPTQGSNPGVLHCRQTLHHLSPQGSPQMTVRTHNPAGEGGFWRDNYNVRESRKHHPVVREEAGQNWLKERYSS